MALRKYHNVQCIDVFPISLSIAVMSDIFVVVGYRSWWCALHYALNG